LRKHPSFRSSLRNLFVSQNHGMYTYRARCTLNVLYCSYCMHAIARPLHTCKLYKDQVQVASRPRLYLLRFIHPTVKHVCI
jgi:hypothetical protein